MEKKRKSKKTTIALVVVAFVAVVAVGFWVWHNDPSFCANPICHDSMNDYVRTYGSREGEATQDKWGFDVNDAHALLVVSHSKAKVSCLDCHTPNLEQQIGEVKTQLSGNYSTPLEERSVRDLLRGSHRESPSKQGDEFCMNDGCHADLTREKLTAMTSNYAFNPHTWTHGQELCSDCHKAHRASVMTCTECHEEAVAAMPAGWVTYEQGNALANAAR